MVCQFPRIRPEPSYHVTLRLLSTVWTAFCRLRLGILARVTIEQSTPSRLSPSIHKSWLSSAPRTLLASGTADPFAVNAMNKLQLQPQATRTVNTSSRAYNEPFHHPTSPPTWTPSPCVCPCPSPTIAHNRDGRFNECKVRAESLLHELEAVSTCLDGLFCICVVFVFQKCITLQGVEEVREIVHIVSHVQPHNVRCKQLLAARLTLTYPVLLSRFR